MEKRRLNEKDDDDISLEKLAKESFFVEHKRMGQFFCSVMYQRYPET